MQHENKQDKKKILVSFSFDKFPAVLFIYLFQYITFKGRLTAKKVCKIWNYSIPIHIKIENWKIPNWSKWNLLWDHRDITTTTTYLVPMQRTHIRLCIYENSSYKKIFSGSLRPNKELTWPGKYPQDAILLVHNHRVYIWDETTIYILKQTRNGDVSEYHWEQWFTKKHHTIISVMFHFNQPLLAIFLFNHSDPEFPSDNIFVEIHEVIEPMSCNNNKNESETGITDMTIHNLTRDNNLQTLIVFKNRYDSVCLKSPEFQAAWHNNGKDLVIFVGGKIYTLILGTENATLSSHFYFINENCRYSPYLDCLICCHPAMVELIDPETSNILYIVSLPQEIHNWLQVEWFFHNTILLFIKEYNETKFSCKLLQFEMF